MALIVYLWSWLFITYLYVLCNKLITKHEQTLEKLFALTLNTNNQIRILCTNIYKLNNYCCTCKVTMLCMCLDILTFKYDLINTKIRFSRIRRISLVRIRISKVWRTKGQIRSYLLKFLIQMFMLINNIQMVLKEVYIILCLRTYCELSILCSNDMKWERMRIFRFQCSPIVTRLKFPRKKLGELCIQNVQGDVWLLDWS